MLFVKFHPCLVIAQDQRWYRIISRSCVSSRPVQWVTVVVFGMFFLASSLRRSRVGQGAWFPCNSDLESGLCPDLASQSHGVRSQGVSDQEAKGSILFSSSDRGTSHTFCRHTHCTSPSQCLSSSQFCSSHMFLHSLRVVLSTQ